MYKQDVASFFALLLVCHPSPFLLCLTSLLLIRYYTWERTIKLVRICAPENAWLPVRLHIPQDDVFLLKPEQRAQLAAAAAAAAEFVMMLVVIVVVRSYGCFHRFHHHPKKGAHTESHFLRSTWIIANVLFVRGRAYFTCLPRALAYNFPNMCSRRKNVHYCTASTAA